MSEHKLFFGGEVQGKIFVNHITDEAIISFPVRVRDLRKLEESDQWKNLCQFLEGFQTQELSMYLPASQVVVEKMSQVVVEKMDEQMRKYRRKRGSR